MHEDSFFAQHFPLNIEMRAAAATQGLKEQAKEEIKFRTGGMKLKQ